MSRKYAECCCCGKIEPTGNMIATDCDNRGKEKVIYMCHHCSENNKPYGTKNNNHVGKVNDGFTFGIEFESTGSDNYARAMFFRFGYIAVHDCSLNDNTTFPVRNDGHYGTECSCEYVSSINHGLKRFTKELIEIENMIKGYHLTLDSSCGTHCHVSFNNFHNGEMNMICNYYQSLFTPVQNVMVSNREKTTKFFGRFFTGYAPTITENCHMRVGNHDDRYRWINATNDNRIEFRLNKFVSAKQYIELLKFEKWMVKTIVDNFTSKYHSCESRTQLAQKTGAKLAKKLEKIYATMD